MRRPYANPTFLARVRPTHSVGDHHPLPRSTLLDSHAMDALTSSLIPVARALSLPDFIANPVMISDWGVQGLPTDTHSIQNGLLVTASTKAVILVDPQGQGLHWVVSMESKRRAEALAAQQATRPSLLDAAAAVGDGDRRSSGIASIFAGGGGAGSGGHPSAALLPRQSVTGARPGARGSVTTTSHGGEHTAVLSPSAAARNAAVTPIRQGGERFREILQAAVEAGEVVVIADVDGPMNPLLDSLLNQHVVIKGASKLLFFGDSFVELGEGFRWASDFAKPAGCWFVCGQLGA